MVNGVCAWLVFLFLSTRQSASPPASTPGDPSTNTLSVSVSHPISHLILTSIRNYSLEKWRLNSGIISL
jgi:hypothetical protein